MGAVAEFNYQTFSTRYPEFAGVSEELVRLYFDEAQLYHANDGSGPVAKATSQLTLLNMVTAHITQLNAPRPENAQNVGNPQFVGPIQSASEGSVSITSAASFKPGSEQWFKQTKYGFAYWQATTAYRTMHYRPNPGRNMNPFFPYYPRR